MLLIEEPTARLLMSVLKQVIDGRVSREEVVSWQRGVVRGYGYEPGTATDVPLGVGEGYWYFLSLSQAAMGGMSMYTDDDWVLREQDMLEYLMDLEKMPARDGFGPLRRVRTHQFDAEALRWPLTTLYMPHDHLEQRGIVSVRGIFDPHLDLVEHFHLQYDEDLYLLVRQFDAMEDRVMILGTNRDQARLRDFLTLLELVI